MEFNQKKVKVADYNAVVSALATARFGRCIDVDMFLKELMALQAEVNYTYRINAIDKKIDAVQVAIDENHIEETDYMSLRRFSHLSGISTKTLKQWIEAGIISHQGYHLRYYWENGNLKLEKTRKHHTAHIYPQTLLNELKYFRDFKEREAENRDE